MMIIGLAALVAAMAALPMNDAQAQGGNCQSLWVQRNSIYKAKGYCFKTARAISYFGNRGCRYDDEARLPLTRTDQDAIASIQSRERALGCQD
jgi:hypothetical protein